MMSFSHKLPDNDFYKKKSAHTLQYTSTPTGVFVSPLDFINKPKPWLTVADNESEEKNKHVVLIFAYHNFDIMERGDEEVSYQETGIFLSLYSAKLSGIKILIQLNNGKLIKWDGRLIPRDYQLDLKIFTHEKILEAAWKQHRIAADDILILDFFATNEFILKEKGVVKFEDFDKNLNKIVEILEYDNDKQSEIHLKNVLSLEVLFDDRLLSLPAVTFNRITQLTIVSSVDLTDIIKICEKYPQVNTLHISLKKTKAHLASLKSCVLNTLKKLAVGFNAWKEREEIKHDIILLSSLTPRLECLSITDCESVILFLSVGGGCFSQISHFNIVIGSAKTLFSFMAFAPNIRKLDLKIEHTRQEKWFDKSFVDNFSEFKAAFETIGYDFSCFEKIEEINIEYDFWGIELKEREIMKSFANKIYKHIKQGEKSNFRISNNQYICTKVKDLNQVFQNIPASCEELVIEFAKKRQEKNKICLSKNALPAIKKVVFECDIYDKRQCIVTHELREILKSMPNLERLHAIVYQDIPLQPDELKRITKLGGFLWDQVNAIREILYLGHSSDLYDNASVSETHDRPPTFDSPYTPGQVTDEDSKFLCAEYFPGLDPSKYRMNLWQPDLSGEGGFMPEDFKSIDFRHKSERGQKGEYNATTNDGNIILPSISLDLGGDLLNFHVIDNHQRMIDLKHVNVCYSETKQFYMLKLPEPGEYSIYFNVSCAKNTFEVKIPDTLKKYQSYKSEIIRSSYKDEDITRIVNEKKSGSCIQRCLAAYYEHVKEYKENIRIGCNTVHTVIEIKIDGKWHCVDLGGVQAEVELQKVQMQPLVTTLSVEEYKKELEEQDEDKEEFAEVEEDGDESEDEEMTSVDVIESKQGPLFPIEKITLESVFKIQSPALVKITSDLVLDHFYKELIQKFRISDVFIAHEPEDLNLNGYGMTHDGKLMLGMTIFSEWLKQLHGRQGVICVDIRAFFPNQLAQLNDLLDSKLENVSWLQNIRIIIIDGMFKSYGDDFKRRVKHHSELSVPTKKSLLETMQPPPDSKEFIEIDLFESQFWKQKLIGSWQLEQIAGKENVFLKWRVGELIKFLALKNKKIIFKNPPLKNLEFSRFIAEIKNLKLIRYADQEISFNDDVKFYQNTGYEFKQLIENTKLVAYTGEEKRQPYYLSNSNLFDFIHDPRYDYDKKTDQLKPVNSHLTASMYHGKVINVICSPNISKPVMAEFLTVAKEKGVHVNILLMSNKNIPTYLHEFYEKEVKESTFKNNRVELSNDVTVRVKDFTEKNPQALCFNLAALDATELSRYPIFDADNFIKTGVFNLTAPLSHLIQALEKGQTVVLYGDKVLSNLYEVITNLALGYADGKPYKGEFKLILSTLDTRFAESLSSVIVPVIASNKITFSQRALKVEMPKDITKTFKELSDQYDKARVQAVNQGFSQSKIVLIEGPTGSGKSFFAEMILSKQLEMVTFDLNVWLQAKPKKNEYIVLCYDEANFKSLTDGSENFLERFESIINGAPGFCWKGKYYSLSENHRVLCLANPLSYGGGRVQSSIEKYFLKIIFEKLPSYYIQERIVYPLLEKNMPKQYAKKLVDEVAKELSARYLWIDRQSNTESLITPREMQTIINLLLQHIKPFYIISLMDLTKEISYFIGQQCLFDKPVLLKQFNVQFALDPLKKQIWNESMPEFSECELYQRETFYRILKIICAMCQVSDFGLGGIILEGNPGIGKSYFLNKIAAFLSEKMNLKIVRISTTASYPEKERLIREAYSQGAIIVAEEMNTSAWPHKLLNELLMKGLKLLTTQNPRSLRGRSEEDPALRRRMIKFQLNWPVFQKKIDLSSESKNAFLAIDTSGEVQASAIPMNLSGIVKTPVVAMDTSDEVKTVVTSMMRTVESKTPAVGEQEALIEVPVQSPAAFFSRPAGDTAAQSAKLTAKRKSENFVRVEEKYNKIRKTDSSEDVSQGKGRFYQGLA